MDKKPAVFIVRSEKKVQEQAAQAIAAGCKTAGASTSILTAKKAGAPQVSENDFVFIGTHISVTGVKKDALQFIQNAPLKDKPVALFLTSAFSIKKAVRAVNLLKKKGALVKNTLFMQVKGPLALLGRGKLEEIDLSRAEAFGERTINYLTGTKIKKKSEKESIKGYKK
ncbi:MAG: hypothetical protein ACE5DI_00160 [Candidatus Micrarchaeia archaeon]